MKLWPNLIFVALMLGCLPEKGKEKENCPTGQAFNSISRSCVNSTIARQSPTGTLSSVTLAEDSGTTSVTLTYSDTNDDIATACTIVSYSATINGDGLMPVNCSCIAGFCSATIRPDTHFYGLAEFRYKISDVDGFGIEKIVGVTVTSVDDTPTNDLLALNPLNGSAINEDTTATWTLGYSDVEGDNASACNIQNTSANVTVTTTCACNSSGICTFALRGIQDYYGNDESFTYQVYANGKWSTPSTVFFDIDPVPDAPILSAVLTYNITEDSDADMVVLMIGSGTGTGTDFVNGTGSGFASDVDTVQANLLYTVSVAPTSGVATLANCMVGTNDLDCDYELTNNNYNSEYTRDTVLVPISAGSILRLRAREEGDHSSDPITVTFTAAASGSGAALSNITGNDLTLSVEQGVTTAKDIKNLIDGDATATALIEVIMLGSAWVDAGTITTVTLIGGKSQTEKIVYTVADADGPGSGSGVININITPQNDKPVVAADIDLSAITHEEDQPANFSLVPGTDVDYTDSLYYRLQGNPVIVGQGTLSNCMDLDGSEGLWDLTCTFTPEKNFASTVTFNYYTSDGVVDADGTTQVTLTIDPVNDNPMICQYSTFSTAPECGLNHCVGTTSPLNSLAAVSHSTERPVYFYETDTAICWKSTGQTSDAWVEDENGHIADYTANQNDLINIENIRLDEGGGDANENGETLTLTIESSDTSIIPLTQIKIYWDGATTSYDGEDAGTCVLPVCTPIPYVLNNNGSEDGVDLKLAISPNSSAVGSSIIKVRIVDTGVPARDVYQTFLVTVTEVGTVHQGWANIKALGPRVDRNDIPLGAPYVCSFSQTKCNGGFACRGSTAPTSVAADELNALYLNEATPSSPQCYIADAQVTIGDLVFRARQEKPVTIEIINDNTITSGNEELHVSGGLGGARHILIKIRSGQTDSDDIEELVNNTTDDFKCGVDMETAPGTGAGDGNCLFTVVNNSPGMTQTVTGSGPYSVHVKQRYVGEYGNLVYISPNGVSIEYKNNTSLAGGGDETVEVTSGNVLVNFRSGVSTSQHVYDTLVAAGTTVTSVVNFAMADPEAPDTLITSMTSTSLAAQSARINWRQLNTYCAISQSDQIEECSSITGTSNEWLGYDLGASCIGYGVPTGNNITLADEDTYYFDAKNNVCYRGQELIAGTYTWGPYPATGSTTLTWKPFVISGTGSITRFEIFRRLGDGDGGDVDSKIDHPFDYKAPINIGTVSSDLTSFTDDFSTSRIPPIPNTVYFYEVRPVVDNILSSSSGSHRFVRLISPPANSAFVHRWMVNQNICELMHANERDDLDPSEADDYLIQDASAFYNCKYHGPGGKTASNHIYDIGKDLIVDIAEAGCPFTKGCSKTGGGGTTLASDGSCIGQGSPSGEITATAAGNIFYDRTNGLCYRANGAGNAWTVLGEGNADTIAAANDTRYNALRNPPAVNVTQQAAYTFCANVPTPTNVVGIAGGDFTKIVKRLPNRRHQIAYSQWMSDISDADIEYTETGLALNASSKCNSSAANGIEVAYVDDAIPPAAGLYALPGDSGTIRSLYTGSDESLSCSSRYGIQDAVGNVAEFMSDRFRCSGDPTDSAIGATSTNKALSQCLAITDNNDDFDGAAYDIARLDTTEDLYLVNDDSAYWGATYSIGRKVGSNQVGPCRDDDNDLECDGILESWVIEDTSYEAGRMFIPMGLPVHSLFSPDTLPNSKNAKSTFAIGSTSGITVSQLHDDSITLNSHYVFSSVNGSGTTANRRGCGAMIAGGGWNDNSGAGVWNFELLPCDDAFGYLVLDELVFRKLTSSTAYEIDMDPCTPAGLPQANDAEGVGGQLLYVYDNIDTGCHTSGNNDSNTGRVMEIHVVDYAAAASNTASEILDLIRQDPDACRMDTSTGNGTDEGLTLCDVFISGTPSLPLSYTKSGTDSYVDVTGDTSNIRSDVGFRCLYEVNSDNGGGDYSENQF